MKRCWDWWDQTHELITRYMQHISLVSAEPDSERALVSKEEIEN
jgi:hypothetical protein